VRARIIMERIKGVGGKDKDYYGKGKGKGKG
jgi:hypothetical protein